MIMPKATTSELVKELVSTFEKHADLSISMEMSKYMKNHFPFLGIKKPLRVELQKPFIANVKLLGSAEIIEAVKLLWNLPEREFQYTAIELLVACKRKWNEAFSQLFIELITEKSWWDTVDIIASKLIGGYYFKEHSHYKHLFIKWSLDENIWLNRVALIHQLSYKNNTDKDLLLQIILNVVHKQNFFIRKGIGWALRQYSYIEPHFVLQQVEILPLSNLSKREAIKAIQRKTIIPNQ
jgi:3-methyladenine DNA glycosylase AlkD